jgi:putative zinc finger/helix-turn-helix YgiT family protein
MNEHIPTKLTEKCYHCSGTMEGRRENYRYTECGLSSVVLLNILVFHCKCGSIVPEIPAIDGLHLDLMRGILRKDTLLCGEEIRFLRKMAGLTATNLAKTIGMAKETISRWENDKVPISGESDRLLRFACFLEFMQQRRLEDKDNLAGVMDQVRQMTSLNLPEVFRQIGESATGPKPIRINPETIGQFGVERADPTDMVQ